MGMACLKTLDMTKRGGLAAWAHVSSGYYVLVYSGIGTEVRSRDTTSLPQRRGTRSKTVARLLSSHNQC